MADRYAFQSPFSRGDQDGWFRLGSLEITTTVALAGVAVLMFFVAAFEGAGGPIFSALELTDDQIANGQIWRLFTWPIPNQPSIWTFVGIVFFYMIGTQLENFFGRRTYTALVGALLVIPTIIALLVSFGLNEPLQLAGIRWVFIGVIAAFVVAFPNAQSFFGIPFWVLAAVIFVLDFLQLLEFRSFAPLAMLITTAIVGLVFSLVRLVTVRSGASFRQSRCRRRSPGPRRRRPQLGVPVARRPRRTRPDCDRYRCQLRAKPKSMRCSTRWPKTALAASRKNRRRRSSATLRQCVANATRTSTASQTRRGLAQRRKRDED